MDTKAPNHLALLPGRCLLLWMVRVDHRPAVVAVQPLAFMDGLRAAQALLSFTGLQREELPLDELLPWAGNV